jgi:hypothetical protein
MLRPNRRPRWQMDVHAVDVRKRAD